MTFASTFHTAGDHPAKKKRRRPRGISTGWDAKTGKVGYTRSVKPKKPADNYASKWGRGK